MQLSSSLSPILLFSSSHPPSLPTFSSLHSHLRNNKFVMCRSDVVRHQVFCAASFGREFPHHEMSQREKISQKGKKEKKKKRNIQKSPIHKLIATSLWVEKARKEL